MAKKLRKRGPSTTPSIVFIELLFPWIVFSMVLVALNALGVEVVVNILLALGASLASMFLIRWERSVRRIRQMRAASSRK